MLDLEDSLYDPLVALLYARNVLQGHDERLLQAVLSEPEYAYLYARDVLKGHDERVLQAVLSNPDCAYRYAHNVLKGHDERLLQAVLSVPFYALRYARDALKGHDERLFRTILNTEEAYYRNQWVNEYFQFCYENSIWAPFLAHTILTNLSKKYRKNPCSAYLLKFASFILSEPEEYSTAELRYFNTLTSIPLPDKYRIML